MSFIESPVFPEGISRGSRGGPQYLTNIIVVKNGREQRNSVWSYPLHIYDAAFGVKKIEDLEELLHHFHTAWGMGNSFRYKDWLDYKSCGVKETISSTDQTLGTGDSTDGSDGTATWQLIKTYIRGSTTKTRLIQKPRSGVLVAVDGTPKTETTHFTVDTTTGIITFTAGNVPLVGEVITAGYQFDVPVRFDTDALSTSLETYRHGEVSAPLIEVRI